MINNIELTKIEYDLLNEIRDKTFAKLSVMTREQRLEWFAHYPHPIHFQKEIKGTVYTVNTHFNDSANETIIEKAERIIFKK